jgi:Kef-type K+ transport system membrane component KefB
MESFGNLALLIGVAAVLGLIANRLKQPLILGYIVAGVLIQLSGVFGEHALEGFELFSTIGIVFLLFILGLELNVKEMMSLGLVSLVTGVGQIIFTVIFGLLIATLLGYDFTAGIILATALTFSSKALVHQK